MANDYLISKWRNWFGFFDHSKEGRICYADVEAAGSKFVSLHHLEGEQKQKAFDTFTKLWSEYVLWGKHEIYVDEFLEKQNAAFKTGKGAFITRMRNCEEIINECIGLSEKDFVSEEDLLIVFKAIKQDDEDTKNKFLQEFNPKRDKIPVKEMVELWTHNLTSEDSSLPDPCVKAMADINL